MLVIAISGFTHQGQWGGGLMFSIASQAMNKPFQGQSQPQEKNRPHSGVTMIPATAHTMKTDVKIVAQGWGCLLLKAFTANAYWL